MTQRRRHTGFTLIEMLISLAILALIAVLGYRATTSLVDSESRLSEESARWRTLDSLFARLEADLRAAQPRPVRTGASIEPAWVGDMDATGNSTIRFSRAGPEFSIETGSAGQRIGYQWNNGAVEVEYWPHLDLPGGTAPAAYALADGIAEFHVGYLDSQGVWRSRWPTLGEPAVPRALKVVLIFSDGAAIERLLVLR